MGAAELADTLSRGDRLRRQAEVEHALAAVEADCCAWATWSVTRENPLLVLEVQRTLDIRGYTDPHHAATVPYTLVLAPGLVIDKVYVGYWFWGRPSA